MGNLQLGAELDAVEAWVLGFDGAAWVFLARTDKRAARKLVVDMLDKSVIVDEGDYLQPADLEQWGLQNST